MLKKILGGILVGWPVVTILVAAAISKGILLTLSIIGGFAIIVGSTALGVWLLTD